MARELLAGFYDVCMRSGLDGVLVELGKSLEVAVEDRSALSDDPRLRPSMIERLGNKKEFDEGGPRNAKPRMLAECLMATLSLTVSEEADRPVTSLGDEVRAEVTAALAAVVDVELAVPRMRDAILAKARKLCEPRHLDSFERIAAQLDERGIKMIRQPKVPLDAVQAIQVVLYNARYAVIEHAARGAIDRAKLVLAKIHPEIATKIDQPITLKLTPRDVAIRRANEARVPKVPVGIVLSLMETLGELLDISWRAVERPVRKYGASQTYVVGDLIEHPKFGRGTVKSVAQARCDVEFSESTVTLVHAGVAK